MTGRPRDAGGGVAGRAGGSVPKGVYSTPKIHLPWHNFIHSGFAVELKVWPATGITNYKKIVRGKCWIPVGFINVGPKNNWLNMETN